MPSHGDFDVIWGAAASLTAADKLDFYTEADIEIVEWGFVMTLAGVWTGTSMACRLQERDADGSSNPADLGGTTGLSGGSPALNTRVFVVPTSAIEVGPGKDVVVEVTTAGAVTPGSGAPFIVYRRKEFHAGLQTNDLDIST